MLWTSALSTTQLLFFLSRRELEEFFQRFLVVPVPTMTTDDDTFMRKEVTKGMRPRNAMVSSLSLAALHVSALTCRCWLLHYSLNIIIVIVAFIFRGCTSVCVQINE
jgi:hypothetical protein